MKKIIFNNFEYNSLKELFLKNKDSIPYKSFSSFEKRFKTEKNVETIINKGKIKTGITKGPYLVEEKLYRDLPSIAKEYGLSERAVYKRFSRGKRGDDLVPVKKRKNYKEPEKKFKFYINGIGYNSKAEACRVNNVKYITYRKRIIWGWSELEALGIKERANVPSTSLLSKNYHGKKRKSGKKIIINDKIFNSISEASRYYNKDPEAVRSSIINGNTPEEALGLKIIFNKNSFEHNGNKYRDLKDFSNKNKFPYELLSSRINRGMTIDEALLLGKKNISNKGRYNLTILNRNKNLASINSTLYFLCIFIDNKTKYKIGITTQNVDKRMKAEGYKFKVISNYHSSLINCFKLEQKILKKYQKYKDLNISASELDGHTEIFNFPENIIGEIKNLIK